MVKYVYKNFGWKCSKEPWLKTFRRFLVEDVCWTLFEDFKKSKKEQHIEKDFKREFLVKVESVMYSLIWMWCNKQEDHGAQ